MTLAALSIRLLQSRTALALLLTLALSQATAQTPPAPKYANPEYTVHPIYRHDARYENLVVRENGQILTTTTGPNASVYQIDPLGILPTILIHTVNASESAVGIAEKEPGLFYFASSYVNISHPQTTNSSQYLVTELDMRKVDVLANGTLSQQPVTRTVANLPHAALLNGAAFAHNNFSQLLIADSFRGLIWNVNVSDGSVAVSLNDTSTKGPGNTGAAITGINGLKVYNSTMYWTNTGGSSLFRIDIDANGFPMANAKPTLIAANITAGVDDLAVDHEGTAYVCGPYNALTKVSPNGETEIIAGTFNSSTSVLGGPSAVRFGKGVSDRYSLYITTNGGIFTPVKNATGISRIDLGYN